MIVVILVLLTICSCSNGQTPDVAKIDQEETYPETPGSLEKVYATFAELEEDASLIAEVEIQSTEVVMLDEFPQTHSQAKVLAALKGDLQTGATIEIVEEGGDTDQGDAAVGVPAMRESSKYILFLDVLDGIYYIKGAFQGKFIEREGYVFQQATEDIKLDDYSPELIDEFKGKV
jgi:hypothetical protein